MEIVQLSDIHVGSQFREEVFQKVIDENNLNVILTDSGYAYHINSKGIDKGSGFLEAVKILDADVNDTIAIGDSETDVPLFKVIKNNIAVSNSTENLKKLAKIITTKKSGEGVLEGLDMMASDFR